MPSVARAASADALAKTACELDRFILVNYEVRVCVRVCGVSEPGTSKFYRLDPIAQFGGSSLIFR